MKSHPGEKKGSLQSRLTSKGKSTSGSSSSDASLPANEFAGDDATGERFAPPTQKLATDVWDDKNDDSTAMSIDTKPSPEQLEVERFCITDDTCVDYSGTDYICVAGKCVPMGGQPAPIEPALEVLGEQPGTKSSMKSHPGEKKGSLQSRLTGKGKSTSESPSSDASMPANEFAGDDATGARFAPPAQKLEAERFCITDDTCVDYSGTDYICVAGKCVPMGGQPAPIEPVLAALGEQPGSKSSMKSQPGQKRGSLQSRLTGKGKATSTSDSSTSDPSTLTNEFAGDDATGERFAPPALRQ